MTDAEKDAVWRSLPEYFKEKASRDYAEAVEALKFDPKNVRIEAHKLFLAEYFGKRNLTAKKGLRFRVGDKAKLTGESYSPKYRGSIVEITELTPTGYLAYVSVINTAVYAEDSDLEPYTEEQKPEDGERDYRSPIEKYMDAAINRKEINLTGKIVDDGGKISVPVSIGYDDSIWLAYRMELAKGIAVNLSRKSNDTTAVISRTMTIVDGIVERLKGGGK